MQSVFGPSLLIFKKQFKKIYFVYNRIKFIKESENGC